MITQGPAQAKGLGLSQICVSMVAAYSWAWSPDGGNEDAWPNRGSWEHILTQSGRHIRVEMHGKDAQGEGELGWTSKS